MVLIGTNLRQEDYLKLRVEEIVGARFMERQKLPFKMEKRFLEVSYMVSETDIV